MTEAETKTTSVAPAVALESVGEGRCTTCGVELGWRDAAYVPASEREQSCKRCYQRAERKALQGEFQPFAMAVLRGGKLNYVARPGNRALRKAEARAEQKRETAKRLARRAGKVVA